MVDGWRGFRRRAIRRSRTRCRRFRGCAATGCSTSLEKRLDEAHPRRAGDRRFTHPHTSHAGARGRSCSAGSAVGRHAASRADDARARSAQGGGCRADIAIENHQDLGSDGAARVRRGGGRQRRSGVRHWQRFRRRRRSCRICHGSAPTASVMSPERLRVAVHRRGIPPGPLSRLAMAACRFRKSAAVRRTARLRSPRRSKWARSRRATSGLFAPDWWEGYPAACRRRNADAARSPKTKRLDDNEDYRTPWERLDPRRQIVAYELAQLHRSVENLKALGWMQR